MLSDAAKRIIEIGKLKPVAAPKIPKGKSVALPEADDEIDDDSQNILDDVGTAYFITYIKSDKSTSQRRVTIRKISKNNKGAILLYCYCHERKALRAFRADRIQEAVDLLTGEVISDFLSVLNGLSAGGIASSKPQPSETEVVLSKARHALNVLVFLGRCDDRLHHSEVDVIYQYIMNKYFEASIDEKVIQNHINRLYPDYETFISSVKHLQSNDDIRHVIRFACQMIQADEIITDDEHRFVEEMQQFMNLQ